MKNVRTALIVGTLLLMTVSCAGISSGVGFYETTGYYPAPYADPLLRPPYYTGLGLGFGPPIYSKPFYDPPGVYFPYRPYGYWPYAYRHGFHGSHHRHRS